MREDYETPTPQDAAEFGRASEEPEGPSISELAGDDGELTTWERDVQVGANRWARAHPREERMTLLEHLQRGANHG